MGIGYKILVRPFLFLIDPETAHQLALRAGQVIGKSALLRKLTAAFCRYSDPILRVRVAGVDFENPIGLAAGFDKNALLTPMIGSVGFGFAEVGSITGEACAGNPRPRLWRLVKDKAIAVYYGLANEGADAIAARLDRHAFSVPIGISIAKTNDPSITGARAAEDYAKSFLLFQPIADYIAVNVSCPNTADGRDFCEPDSLGALLRRLDQCGVSKPVFLKIKPDMAHSEFDRMLAVCGRFPWITGFIISNLTHARDNLKTDSKVFERKKIRGGISGKPAQKLSNEPLAYAYKKTRGRYALIGCGGVFSGRDAYEKIRLGASLVELITGMIYEGPTLIGKINKELAVLLRADGFRSVREAVGTAHGKEF